MKKILVYINSMAPSGGIERVVANLFNELSKNEIDIIILTKDKKDSFYELNKKIKIISINNYLKLDLKMTKWHRSYQVIKNIIKGNIKLRKKLNEVNPDFIYVVSPLEALEIFLNKNKKAKLIITEHGSKLGYNKIYNIIKKVVYPKAYKLIVPSTLDTELYLKEKYPAVYIPHLSTYKDNKKNELNSKIVLNIGRYTDDKQQEILIEIWSKLSKENLDNDWKLYIVGSGENKEKLRKKIIEYQLENVIKLLEPQKDIENYFKKASIFAFTSRYEGFGMVLLEAMSFGIPCISFNCPSGPRDIIKNNQTGYLVDNFDKEKYKNSLSILIKDEKLRKELGVKAYEFSKKWDNEDIIEKWKNIIGEVNEN